MKKIRDAVSLIFEHKGKIFSIQRQNYLRAFPGYTAFIGGKVDPEDYEDLNYSLSELNKHPVELRNAIVRETKEELGIEVDRLLEQGIISSIDYIGRALTPKFNPYRFNTHFFRISFVNEVEFSVDKNEVKASCWSYPSEVYEQWSRGNLMMVPPVRFFIEKLHDDIYFTEPLIFENRFDLKTIVPWIETISGLKQIMPLSNTVPPAERTNAFIVGDDRSILIDPSPKNNDELSRFLETIKNENINEIFITHHHKDHHQSANEIARKFNIPMGMSSFTKSQIEKVYGLSYFEDIRVKNYKENDILCSWKNEDIVVIEVPGHDEGQLAIMPKSKKWFLAGDLFQGVGTVVVGGEEGNMKKYMDTLSKVISLGPHCVIPSHGIALGGTHIIEKTLEHRKFREQQVLDMHKEGLDIDQMLKRIYFDIPDKILKYARANIESHLLKLKEEGKV